MKVQNNMMTHCYTTTWH